MSQFGSALFHAGLVNDADRMHAYQRAIQWAVRPGDTVLDVGTGSGVLAMFAVLAGARRVYAVEREDIIALARQTAEANGLADRISFLQSDVKRAEIPEPVDVITSELISKAVIGQSAAETIGYCRNRWLRPGGRVVPASASLMVAPIEHAGTSQATRLPSRETYGIDWSSLQHRASNCLQSARIPPEALLADGAQAYRYDALTAGSADYFEASLSFSATRAGNLDGFVCWFVADLGGGIGLSNAPPGNASWNNLVLPLPESLAISSGTSIDLTLSARDDSRMPLTWRWNTVVGRGTASSRAFRQSTLAGQVLTAQSVRPRSPAPGDDGEVVQL